MGSSTDFEIVLGTDGAGGGGGEIVAANGISREDPEGVRR